jgi:hypothetical protein
MLIKLIIDTRTETSDSYSEVELRSTLALLEEAVDGKIIEYKVL